MDKFYLKNAALYETLVNKLDPIPGSTSARETEICSQAGMTVSARIRPLLEEDVAAGFPCAIFPRSAQPGAVDIHELYNHPRGRPVLKSFNYAVDQIFDSETTTQQVYQSLVADLIPFARDGGIATLFTYGQTGSGKTFTVTGLQRLVAESLMGEDLEGERKVSLTIIDLAGNSAYDLLNGRSPVMILEDAAGVTHLTRATDKVIESRQEMVSLIERAAKFRRTARTTRNDASSRSHAICRIRITNPSTKSNGFLYLIDLAGSEAARDINSHGDSRMRETREINMSLSVLKDCIRGKAESELNKQKKPYVPFRRSALTKILKHVFDPDEARPCKTVVIACLNPGLADVGPSKNALRFAEMLRVVAPATDRVEKDLMGGYRKVQA